MINHLTKLSTTKDTGDTGVESFLERDLTAVSSMVERWPLAESALRAY